MNGGKGLFPEEKDDQTVEQNTDENDDERPGEESGGINVPGARVPDPVSDRFGRSDEDFGGDRRLPTQTERRRQSG